MVDEVAKIAKARGKEPAQIALNWVASRPGVSSPIIGARDVQQLEGNLGAVGFSLEDSEVESLEETAALPYAYPYNMIARANS